MMITRRFDYEQHGGSGMNGCPMIPHWRLSLGTDKSGKEWLCEIHPDLNGRHLMFHVDFDNPESYWVPIHDYDTDENRSWSMPFLRSEVLYAEDGKYSKAIEKYYHRKTVEYFDIYETIDEFCERKGIK